MPFVSVFVEQEEIDKIVDLAIAHLGPDVVRVNYEVGVDTSDEPCIRFRIVLTDEASEPDRWKETTRRITSQLSEELHPFSRWGFTPYYYLRSESEQATLCSPEWS